MTIISKVNMGCFHPRVLLTVFVLASLAVSCDGMKTVIELRSGPRDTVTREGDTATLECSVDHKDGDTLRWYRVTNNVYTAISSDDRIEDGAMPATGTYEITGDHTNGEYNLRITEVNLQDSGVYHCGFERGIGLREDITSLGADLEVVVSPDITSPICVLMDNTSSESTVDPLRSPSPPAFSVGDVARLVCLSSGGVPPASLEWKGKGKRLAGLTEHYNILYRVIEESDLDVEFTCYAESPALEAPRSCSLTPARRPHDVRIMPELATVALQGGITISCEATPDYGTYLWLFKGYEVPNNDDKRRRLLVSDDTKSLTVGSVVWSDDGAEIVCMFTSRNGRTGQATAVLRVEGIPNSTSEAHSTFMDYSPTSEYIGSPSDEALTTKMLLIIAGSIAGVAIAALAIITIAFIYRKHKRTKNRNSNPNNVESIPSSIQNVRVKQMKQVKTPADQNRERIDTGPQDSEDGGYTALQRPIGSTGEYQNLCHSPPTAPRLDLATAADDDNMCWDYEIPYEIGPSNQAQPVHINTTNPVYLEIV